MSAPRFDVGSGPAFPIDGTLRGLTVRDYLAAQALPAMIAEYHRDISLGLPGFDVAHAAYANADAMLAARGKP